MQINLGDTVKMKKQHPCGCDIFKITRIGMDFKLLCTKCGREVMLDRRSAEKAIKKIINGNGEENV
ncbi:MAG: DUF951 domain-containing protein [Clostridia bacterium]|nr:DUF951 domain-containing protein [Clostridia bacterium]